MGAGLTEQHPLLIGTDEENESTMLLGHSGNNTGGGVDTAEQQSYKGNVYLNDMAHSCSVDLNVLFVLSLFLFPYLLNTTFLLFLSHTLFYAHGAPYMYVSFARTV